MLINWTNKKIRDSCITICEQPVILLLAIVAHYSPEWDSKNLALVWTLSKYDVLGTSLCSHDWLCGVGLNPVGKRSPWKIELETSRSRGNKFLNACRSTFNRSAILSTTWIRAKWPKYNLFTLNVAANALTSGFCRSGLSLVTRPLSVPTTNSYS